MRMGQPQRGMGMGSSWGGFFSVGWGGKRPPRPRPVAIPRAMCSLKNLGQLQDRILQRITQLELSTQTQNSSSLSIINNGSGETMTESRLSKILVSRGAKDFIFKRVPSDYYVRTIEARRDILGDASVGHLCKSIVLVIVSFSVRLAPEEDSAALNWICA